MMIHLVMRLGFHVSNIFYFILLRILHCIHRMKSPVISIPPVTNALFTLSATTIARKIRLREITSYEVVYAYIERIKEVNPILNAVVDDRFKNALLDAATCDDQLKMGMYDMSTLEKEKPLYGVPLTVKECCPVKGLSYTGCTLAYKGRKATADAVCVETLRNAGAIPLCVTNTPEMCGGYHSNNLIYGQTFNPYDIRYTSGGSSGGEGALLGAGASLIGIGSDLAGSIRVPAHFNGIFGFKPTPGIIPSWDHFPSSKDKNAAKYLTFGPMARYSEDISLIMRIMSPKCDRDLRLDVPVDIKGLRVFYRESWDKSLGMLSMTPEIEECVSTAAKYFRQSGVRTEKLPIEWPSAIVEIVMAMLLNMEDSPQLIVDINDHQLRKNASLEMLKALFGQSQHTKSMLWFAVLLEINFPLTKKNISYYVQQGEKIEQKLIELLGEDGVFIYPTCRIPATYPNLLFCEFNNTVSYAGLANVFGFPSIHVPMGLNREGLPIGFQVTAAPYQDRLCLAVAKELEKAFGGWIPPSISIRD